MSTPPLTPQELLSVAHHHGWTLAQARVADSRAGW